MLHFDSMILKNFGPYEGEQTIDFTEKKGVTIIWGNNGRGKTTLLNAFRYALFNEVFKRAGKLENIYKMENSEAAKRGEHGFSVTLKMTNNGDSYKLTREYKPLSGVTDPKNDEDYEMLVFLNKNGNILSNDQRDHELNMIMPVDVARFFLFDAELLQEYEDLLDENAVEGEKIKEAIEKILGLPVLNNGMVDIKQKLTDLSRNKNQIASKNKKAKDIVNEIEILDQQISQHNSDIANHKEMLQKYKSQLAVLETQMNSTEKLRGWIADRKKASETLTDLETKLANVEVQLKTALGSAWKNMLGTTVRDLSDKINKEKEELDNKRNKSGVADHFIREMRSAVAEKVCPICGQDVSDTIIETLKKKIKENSSEFKGLSNSERERLYTLNNMSSDLKWLKENIGITDVKATIANLESQRDDDKIKIDTNKQIIDDCTDNIKRSGLQQSEDVIQSYAKKYADIDSKIKAELNGINRQQEDLRKQQTTKEGLSKQLDKMSSSDSEFEKVKNQYKICEGLYNIFKESKEAYREELKKNVELDASSFFVQLSEDPDYTGLKINQNYGLEIIHKSGSIVPGRSSGYEHLVALSLIGALHKNAPLRGPIIIDSPFGRLDPQNKKNMIRTLPSMADQVILLAYTDEIDNQTARKELGNNLLAEYSLKRISSMHTEIEKS